MPNRGAGVHHGLEKRGLDSIRKQTLGHVREACLEESKTSSDGLCEGVLMVLL